MDTDVFAIGIYNALNNRLEFSGALENDQVLPDFHYDLNNNDYLASLCYNIQKEIIIYDYLAEAKDYLKQTPEPRAGGMVGSMIYLPLNFKAKQIGVITVQSLKTNAYHDFHVNYVQNLAAYIAIALENANTYLKLDVQNKFNVLLKNTIPNPMFFKDSQAIYRDVNPAFLNFIGKTHDEVIGRTVFDVAPFELAEIYKGKDDELFRDKKIQIYESAVKLGDGTIRNVRFYKDVLRTEDGKIGGILGIILDITDLKHTEEQLLIFKKLAEASDQGFCIADQNGQIFYANPKLNKLINEESGDRLEGKKLGISFPGSTYQRLLDEIIPSTVETGRWTGEMERVSRSGKRIYTIENFFIIRGTSEDEHFIANISTDISHQKEIERTLTISQQELQESNRSKDGFFSIISHDLKSPFNSILGFTELLLTEFDDLPNSEKIDYLKQINKTAGLTYSLIEDLLTWARSQSGQISLSPVQFDFFDLAEKVISIFQYSIVAKQISFSSKIKRETFVFADKNIISTVLRNLISNSIKFTPDGGNISLSVSNKQSDKLDICIEDTGIGISESDQQKIFKIEEKFILRGTNNELGTGMGLKLCKELIEINNGRMWFESKQGVGSRFYFSIPQAPYILNGINK